MARFLQWLSPGIFYKKRRFKTVRYMFPTVVLAATVLGAQLIATQNTSYVRLEANNTAVASGDRFYIDVFVHAAVPVNAIDITITFKEKAVEVLEVDRGRSVLTIWTEDPIIESDKVILRGGTFKKGFLGEHKIARIDFRAKETGASQLSIDDILLLAGDGKGTQVKTADANKTVSLIVYDENATADEIRAMISVQILTDIDGDGKVTLRDISAFMAAWTSQSRMFDFNNDGYMGFKDFSIILADFFFKG